MVKLYTTHCPQCKGIESKLKAKGIDFEEISDEEKIIATGKTSVPILEVDNKLLVGKEIYDWVNDYGC